MRTESLADPPGNWALLVLSLAVVAVDSVVGVNVGVCEGVAVAVGSSVGVCEGGMGVFVSVGACGVGVTVCGTRVSVVVGRIGLDVSITMAGESCAQLAIKNVPAIRIRVVSIHRICIKLNSSKLVF